MLILVIGPVHAQSVFACAMMDMVMYSGCSHDGHKKNENCVDSVLDTAAESGDDPCCEQSVKLSIDEVARQATPIVKPAEVLSDADQPQAIVASFNVIEPRRTLVVLRVIQTLPGPGRSGSDIYLITQRLRI